jgi:predicted acylesterase/phospholipase RssA
MDPYYELAGWLLRRFYDQWPLVTVADRRSRKQPWLQRKIDELASRFTDRLPGFARLVPAPCNEQTREAVRARVILALRAADEPDSIRRRRDTLVRALYADPEFALGATRCRGQYSSLVEEVALEAVVAIEVPYQLFDSATAKTRRKEINDAIARSDERLGDFASRLRDDDAKRGRLLANRLAADPDFLDDLLQILQMARPFTFVLQRELDEIEASRRVRLNDCDREGVRPGEGPAPIGLSDAQPPSVPVRNTTPPIVAALDAGLVGLSLSGGGIRSATFSLGVLQSLAELDVLRRVDLLSTVSGGGYIGGWLVAWIKRLHGGVLEVQQRLSPKRAAAATSRASRPVQMLREYSNYLTPVTGIFSADSWTLVSVWVRNTILNQVVLLLFLGALLLLPRAAVPAVWAIPDRWLFAIFLAGLTVAGVASAGNLRRFAERRRPKRAGAHELGQTDRGIFWYVLTPITIGALAGAFWLMRVADPQFPIERTQALQMLMGTVGGWLSPRDAYVLVMVSIIIFAGLCVIQIRGRYAACIHEERPLQPTAVQVALTHLGITAASIATALVAGLLTVVVLRIIDRFPPGTDRAWWVATFGPALIIQAIVFALVLHIGLLGRDFPDGRREWWSRLGAYQLRVNALWLGVFAVSIFGPAIGKLGIEMLPLAAGWIGTTVAGVIAARSAQTSGENGTQSIWKEWVALVAPYIFVAGLLLGVSLIVDRIVPMNVTALGQPAVLLFTSSVLCLVLGWRVDVNEFSMHHFYKNRLVRCYFGASRDREERRPNRFTGFDPQDDVKLSALRTRPADPHDNRPYWGPYLIVNTSLNLTKGQELAWQERKAEAFVFTPQYVGYDLDEFRPVTTRNLRRAGYRRTEHFAYPLGPMAGTAAAISGAATNPNMGHHTSPATAFLMTVFNARLGWWVGNPRRRSIWRQPSPRLGLMYLLRELFARADNTTHYVNLSDGGHFENLGLYELIRRRCRFIIAVDAEQDPLLACGGLANVIRKCRTDFDVEIEIDLDPIRRKDSTSSAHCAVGSIRYPEPDSPQGRLVYIKSCITGDESPDIQEYMQQHADFPHQSTSDQWFDESQFESYRRLGYHAAMVTLEAAAAAAIDTQPPVRVMPVMFEYLDKLWLRGDPATTLRHASEYQTLLERFRTDPALTTLDAAIYPNLSNGSSLDRNTLYAAHSLVEFMYRVFSDLDLDLPGSGSERANWMPMFRAWKRNPAVGTSWLAVQSHYDERFRVFYEKL